MSRYVITWLCVLVLSTMVWQSYALAQTVYDPSSGSYFELYKVEKGELLHHRWHDVQKVAAGRFHNGIRGQLATIKTRKTHEFIKENFHIKWPTWIGLRYMCSSRTLVWVSGERVNRGCPCHLIFAPFRQPFSRTNGVNHLHASAQARYPFQFAELLFCQAHPLPRINAFSRCDSSRRSSTGCV